MLPARALGKRLPQAAAALRPALLRARFQSLSTGQKKTETEPAKEERSENSRETPSKNSRESPNNRPRRPPLNKKLRDISVQVRSSVDKAAPAELAEAVDILEEGISYLREIQGAEGIAEESLYSLFQAILAVLVDKAAAPDANLGTRTLSDVLDMLIEHKIAHNYHFTKVACGILQNTEKDPAAYSQVLQVWLKWLEYAKSTGAGVGWMIRKPFMLYHERGYLTAHLGNLAYFSYVILCLKSGATYSIKDAMKLLQITETKVPERFHVRSSIARLGLNESLKEDLALYEAKIGDLNLRSMDPNGKLVLSRIENAVFSSNRRLLQQTYQLMQVASVENELPITEATLRHVMNAHIELHNFDDVVEIFQSMLAGGMQKPSAGTWGLVLKSMGHPARVKEMSEKAKDAAVQKVEAAFATMEASVPVNPRTLAIVVGCFANLNRLDKVEEYLAKHPDVPVVHVTRNNILVGMVLNKNVAAAEAKMKAFVQEDPSYVPSTLVVNSFLSHYVREDNYDAVEGLMNYMKQNNIEEDVGTFTTILDFYFKLYRKKGKVPDVAGLLAELSSSKSNFQFNSVTLTAILDALTKDGVNMDAARAIYEHFTKTTPRLRHDAGMMTTMIAGELEFGSVYSAESMFDEYLQNCRNDIRIWNLMIRSTLKKKESLALGYYAKLLKQAPFNVKPNHFTYFFLLDHFLKTGNAQRVQWTLDQMGHARLDNLGNVLPKMLMDVSRKYKVDPQLLGLVRN